MSKSTIYTLTLFEILAKAKYAALSTHFSLLPEYRGFAPVNWAIINGESKCGVSLFHMESDVDSGDIVAQRTVEIGEHDYASDVMDRCIVELKDILNETWEDFSKGNVARIPQDHSKATFTCARNPEDGEINWSDSTKTIYNLIRGVSKPFPGAFTYLKGHKLTIWTAELVEVGKYVGRIPGKVIQLHKGKGVVVLTGDGALLIKNVMLEAESLNPDEDVTADTYIKSVRLTLGK